MTHDEHKEPQVVERKDVFGRTKPLNSLAGQRIKIVYNGDLSKTKVFSASGEELKSITDMKIQFNVQHGYVEAVLTFLEPVLEFIPADV